MDFATFAKDLHAKSEGSARPPRRAFLLQAAQEYWKLIEQSSNETAAQQQPGSSYAALLQNLGSDPLDFEDSPSGVVNQRGLIIRTDFSNEERWTQFLDSLLKAEKDGMDDLLAAMKAASQGDKAEDDESEESSDEEEEEGESGDIEMQDATTSANTQSNALSSSSSVSETFIIIDPTSPSSSLSPNTLSPTFLQNASNLALLRQFNDVDVILSPPVPTGRRRLKSASRLIDSHAHTEIYHGRLIWVYDSKSNLDGCVRVVSNRPDVYGTATGDSWRARASFIWELQINISGNTMSISFGGEDRYDGSERQRNIEEAVAGNV